MFKFLFIPRSEEFPGNCERKDEDFDSTSWPVEYVKDDPWNDSESSNNCVDTESFEGGNVSLEKGVSPIVIDETLFVAIFLTFLIEFIKVKVE
jgi:hypothetical protein